MPNENDEREEGAAAIPIPIQRDEAVQPDESMRSTNHPPSAPDTEELHPADDMDESPQNESNTGRAASDLSLRNRKAAAVPVFEHASEAPEQSVAAPGDAPHAATATQCQSDFEVVDNMATVVRPNAARPNQHANAKKQGSPSSAALSAKSPKEKASPASDVGSPKSGKLPGKNDGRRPKNKAQGSGSPRAMAGRNDEPDPKPAFMLKHQLFHQPRHKKATATDSPNDVNATAMSTPSGDARRASSGSKKRALQHGPALDPLLKRKLIEGPESSLVVEGSVAQHVLNRIGKLRHEAVPSSVLYGSRDDTEGRTKERGAVASSPAKKSNHVKLREVVDPSSSHDEPLFRITTGPFRGLIGQWMCFQS
jgi:hypothetical protein